MLFGVSLPNNQGASMRDIVRLACAAEALGYDSVWVSEHLFHASYVAERLGDRPYHEALTALTAVAAATSRVRLGTSVLVLPWHHPVRLAKQIASLDEFSDGRVTLGVGVAQTDDEYANLNVPFHRRGRMADEILDAMACLWWQDVPSFAGEWFQFDGLRFEPKPVQKPLPLLIGGNSDRALRRVREKGTGWHGLSRSPDEVRAAVAKLGDDKTCSIRGMLALVDEPWERPVTERRTLKGTVEELIAMVTAYADAGADEIVIDANTPDCEAALELFERFAAEVVGP